MSNGCNVIIKVAGLAIKNPDKPGLNLDFLYEEFSSCHHKLKLTVNGANKEFEIPPRSNIKITTSLADPIPKSPDLRKILNLNTIHGHKLKQITSTEVSLINLDIPNAIPYSMGETDTYKIKWKDTGNIIKEDTFTQEIGAWYSLNPRGEVVIEGLPTQDGNPLKLPYKEGEIYELIFDNTCGRIFHNDFYLYYKVLKANDSREVIINNPAYSNILTTMDKDLSDSEKDFYKLMTDLIACNPIEGGGG